MICGGKDCIYRAPLNSSPTEWNTYCDKLSHCKPSTLKWFYDLYGIDRMDDEHWAIWNETPCPFYTPDPKKKAVKKEKKNFDAEKALALYQLGKRDTDIAKALHTNSTEVRRWRIANDLPVHTIRRVHVDEKRIEELYAQGLPDYKIAREAGCGEKYVSDWRKRNDYEPHRVNVFRIDYSQMRKLWEDGKSDREICVEIGCSVGAVGSWRKKEGLAPNYTMRRRQNL